MQFDACVSDNLDRTLFIFGSYEKHTHTHNTLYMSGPVATHFRYAPIIIIEFDVFIVGFHCNYLDYYWSQAMELRGQNTSSSI